MITINRPDIDEIIFLSDIHFGVHSSSSEWIDNISDYFYKWFIPYIKKEKKQHSPCLIIAGDYFDNRNHLDIQVLNTAFNVMKDVSKIIDVFFVIGNHDIYKTNDNSITSLKIFDTFKNVNVIYELSELIVKNNKKLLLISWVGNMTNENKLITQYKDGYDFMVLHTELSGMTYDNNRPIVDGVNMNVVSDSCKIISGHIHKRQEGKKGIYLGSPYHTMRSDIDNIKGIYSYIIEDDKIIQNFIANDYSPRYIKVEYSSFGRDTKNWKDIVKNNYVDIYFNEEDAEKINVNNFINELQEYHPKGLQYFMNRKVVVLNEETASNERLYHNDDIEDVFNNKIPEFGLKKTEIKKLDAMNKCYIKKAEEELSK